ncbi:hypothetical protein [Streptomyces sp. NPDC047928]|uniref:hypothetical protein n=1 Tax=unclassified Streptomyces TaxID=2593676 RepID=UPI003722B25A
MSEGARACVHCTRPITGPSERVPAPDGGSGFRPELERHPECGPGTAPYTRSWLESPSYYWHRR